MFRGLLKRLKGNKNIVYYVIIAVLLYLIYTEYKKKERFDVLAPAPAPALANISNICPQSEKKSVRGCLTLMSLNELYKLEIDFVSGNLQIINIKTNENVWRNNNKNQGKGPFRLVMQDDRNLVVYDSSNKAIWASNTVLKDKKQYKGPYRALLENDGVLRIRDNMNLLVWESNREQKVHKPQSTGILLNDVKNISQSELDMYKNDEYRTMEDLFRIMLSAKLSRNIDLFKKLKKTSKIGAGILSKLDEMNKYWGPVNYIENRKRLEDGLRKMGLYGKRGFEKVPYLAHNFVAPKIFDKSWIDKYYYSVDNLYNEKNEKQLDKNVPYLPILIHIKKKDVSLKPYKDIPLSEFDVQYINEDKYVKKAGNDLELMGELNYYYYIIGLYVTKDINILKDMENNSTKQLLQKVTFDEDNVFWTNDVYKENEKRLNDILNVLGAI